MPYIDKDCRIDMDLGDMPRTPGELNYCITKLLSHYAADNGESYTTYNTIVGALESAKLEFYRRVVIPYENTKRDQNGDVY